MTFHKWFLQKTWIIFFLVLSVIPTDFCFALEHGDPEVTRAINSITAQIEKRHAIEIFYTHFSGAFPDILFELSACGSDDLDLLRFLYLLKKELNKYPPGFFKKIGLRKIFVLKKLFRREMPAEGLYGSGEIIVFDFYRKKSNPVLQQHTIHHEIFHVLDHFFEKQYSDEDDLWRRLNEQGFTYGQQNLSFIAENTDHLINRGKKGFITPYAMSSVKEDKAEIFACLMIPSQRRILYRWMKDDRILRNKVSYLKNYLNKISGAHFFNY